MKQYINNLYNDDWTKELVYEFTDPLKISMFVPKYPVHYYVKDFGKQLKEHYGRNASVL